MSLNCTNNSVLSDYSDYLPWKTPELTAIEKCVPSVCFVVPYGNIQQENEKTLFHFQCQHNLVDSNKTDNPQFKATIKVLKLEASKNEEQVEEKQKCDCAPDLHPYDEIGIYPSD